MEQVDRDILDWIAEHTSDAALTEQIATATIKKRDYMRTGFFVYFDAPPESATPSRVRPVCPHLDAPDLLDGAGCDLFLRAGYLHYLEVYARGGFLPETLKNYTLSPSKP